MPKSPGARARRPVAWPILQARPGQSSGHVCYGVSQELSLRRLPLFQLHQRPANAPARPRSRRAGTAGPGRREEVRHSTARHRNAASTLRRLAPLSANSTAGRLPGHLRRAHASRPAQTPQKTLPWKNRGLGESAGSAARWVGTRPRRGASDALVARRAPRERAGAATPRAPPQPKERRRVR